ncbi:MAG: substrate-binding periplasmic protein [Endozoicomonas sp.]|uniref:substrate-binding periplasmic protein n=1 Tax=Endozoicomonas sp. TaxID=1892382 RepID=UPI003D9B327B
MRYLSRLFGVFLMMSLFSSVSQAVEKLYLLTENYPPFNMSIEDKNFARESGIDGVSVEIVKEIMKRSNIQYSMTLRSPWSRIYKMALEKNNYGLFSTALTDERKPLFKWVGPLVANDLIVLKKAGSTLQVDSLEDLKKYRVGGYKGDISSEYLKSRGIPVIEAALDKHNAEKLEAGRIDLWASSRFSAPFISEAAGLPQAVPVYTYTSVDFYLALNRNVSDDVVTLMQSTLDLMKREGKVTELTENYL